MTSEAKRVLDESSGLTPDAKTRKLEDESPPSTPTTRSYAEVAASPQAVDPMYSNIENEIGKARTLAYSLDPNIQLVILNLVNICSLLTDRCKTIEADKKTHTSKNSVLEQDLNTIKSTIASEKGEAKFRKELDIADRSVKILDFPLSAIKSSESLTSDVKNHLCAENDELKNAMRNCKVYPLIKKEESLDKLKEGDTKDLPIVIETQDKEKKYEILNSLSTQYKTRFHFSANIFALVKQVRKDFFLRKYKIKGVISSLEKDNIG